MGWCLYRRRLPERIRRRDAVDTSRHRRYRLDGRRETMDCEGAVGNCGEEFDRVRARVRKFVKSGSNEQPTLPNELLTLATLEVTACELCLWLESSYWYLALSRSLCQCHTRSIMASMPVISTSV